MLESKFYLSQAFEVKFWELSKILKLLAPICIVVTKRVKKVSLNYI